VRALNRAGTTVLLTTHYLEEAEELCDRIAIIHHGELVACDTTANLLRRLDSKTLIVTPTAPIAAMPVGLDGLLVELPAPDRLVVRYKPSTTRLGDILGRLASAGIGIADLTTEETDLEDIFLQLTRRGGPNAR
jgi:ABC-2 type transport system ATP-binding protein